jgi:hypothetical protein
MRANLANRLEHVLIPINDIFEINFKILKEGELLEYLN